MADLALAVDIGGTKMAAGLVDFRRVTGGAGHGADAEERRRVRVRARWRGGRRRAAVGGPEGLVSGLVGAAGPGDRLVVCGVGCGGPMSPGGEQVSPLNIPAWRGFPLRVVDGRP